MTDSPADRPTSEQTSSPADTTRPRPPVPHRRSTAAWTLLVPGLVLAATVAVVLGWRDELPDPVASHWGADGVDGYSSLTGLVVVMVTISAVFCLVMWATGHWRGHPAMTRRFANGMAVWLTAFLSGILLGTLWIQRRLTHASEVGDVGGVLALSMVTATVAGGLAAWATPGDEPRPTSAPVPVDAPRLNIAENEQVTWVREVGQRAMALILVVSLGPLVVVAAVSGEWLFPAVLAAIVVPLVLAFVRWTVVIDRHGLTARSVLRYPRLRVPLDEVERAEVVTINPLGEFGGWGLRTGIDGRTGVVLRAGPAIQVHRTGGRVVVVTVDDAQTAVAALNTLASRLRDREPTTD